VFRGKISHKLLIMNSLPACYRAHFARFCATFCCRCMPIGGEARPLEMLLASLFCILFRMVVILCKKAQRQQARMDMGYGPTGFQILDPHAIALPTTPGGSPR